MNLGDLCEKGHQLRPHIVWFGEEVPMMEKAAAIASQAEIFVVVGTSMVVYPAAGLINFVAPQVPKFVIDPNLPDILPMSNLSLINKGGGDGLSELKQKLLEDYGW